MSSSLRVSISSPSPAAFGCRMPAEWERHAATWIGWPHNRTDWPGRFEPIPWVYAEIARVIAEHPAVADVCIYGVPAQSGAPGEQDVVAAIVPTDRTQWDAASIFAACRRALTANAVPSYLQVVPEIPKTLSEKPQQRILREHFDPAGLDVFTP